MGLREEAGDIPREAVQAVMDELNFADGSDAHAEIERGLTKVLALPSVRHAVIATLTDNEIEAALRLRSATTGRQ